MIASSMTIPTIRVSASIVIWFNVKPIAAISAKVEMIEVGMATAAISVVRQLARNRKMTIAAKNAAFDQVVPDVLDRRLDEDRLIADHLGLDILRQRRRDLVQPLP